MAIRCPFCNRIIDQDNELRRVRVRRGLMVPEAAAQVGVSGSTWYKWENGSSYPSPKHRERLQMWLAGG